MINKNRTKIKEIIEGDSVGKEFEIWGWVRTSRFSKNVGFIEVNDGSTIESLQLVAKDKVLEGLDGAGYITGASINAKGIIEESSGSGQSKELKIQEISLIGKVDEEYPLQKKKHSLEFLREYPHLRSRTSTFLSLFRVRNELAKAIHDFFQGKGFLYTHSPIFTVNDCEGGGETFQATSLDLNKLPMKDGKVDYGKDIFRKPVYLTVSGQLEAEPFALSHGEVYTFGPTFRADPSNTPKHAAEFWMIEPEMAFYDFEDLKDLIEEFVKFLATRIKITCEKEINFFSENFEPGLLKRFDTIIKEGFAVVSYTDAIEILKASRKKFENEAVWGQDLFTEHERYLAEEHFGKPVFVTNYPESFKSFYMRINEDKKTVACLDLLVPGIGEVLTGSQREERYKMLKERMEQKGMEEDLYKWYLETRRWGSAPHSGFGIGFERILMYFTGMKNIRDVIPFPRAGRVIY